MAIVPSHEEIYHSNLIKTFFLSEFFFNFQFPFLLFVNFTSANGVEQYTPGPCVLINGSSCLEKYPL